jgi:hypothetical protein
VSALDPPAAGASGLPRSPDAPAEGTAAAAASVQAGASSAAPQPGSGGEPGPRRTAGQVLKDIVLFFAAPFVTLVYLALFPFIGMKLLAQAWRERKQAG